MTEIGTARRRRVRDGAGRGGGKTTRSGLFVYNVALGADTERAAIAARKSKGPIIGGSAQARRHPPAHNRVSQANILVFN